MKNGLSCKRKLSYAGKINRAHNIFLSSLRSTVVLGLETDTHTER